MLNTGGFPVLFLGLGIGGSYVGSGQGLRGQRAAKEIFSRGSPYQGKAAGNLRVDLGKAVTLRRQ